MKQWLAPLYGKMFSYSPVTFKDGRRQGGTAGSPGSVFHSPANPSSYLRHGVLVWSIGFMVLCACTIPVAASMTEEDRKCLRCHLRGSPESQRQIDLASLKASVHWGEVGCAECHPGAKDKAHDWNVTVTPVNCRRCHDQEIRHGLKSGKPARCWDCHGGHDVFPSSDARSRLHTDCLVGTCGVCHANESEAGSVPASLFSFRVKGHGKGDLSQSYSPDRCLACHRPETAHRVSEQERTQGCRSCHNPETKPTALLGTFHGTSGGARALSSPGQRGDAVYLGLVVVLAAVFVIGWIMRIRIWLSGGAARRWDQPGKRVFGWIESVVGQRKVFDRKMAGIGHYLIFLGVGVPIFMVVVAQFRPALGSSPARMVSLLLDLLGLGLLAGLAMVLVRRIWRPSDLPAKGPAEISALVLLVVVLVTGFLTEGFRLATAPGGEFGWSPVGGILAMALPSSVWLTAVTWRLHLLLALTFLAVLSWTRLRHLVTAPLNIFFRDLGPMGRLEPVPVAAGERFGVSQATDLTWKDILDTDSCVDCGRCTDVCPAYATGKPLSPMKVIQDFRADAEARCRPVGDKSASIDPVHGRISPDEAWACATCYACRNVCPVYVDHVDKLVGLRRALVMDQGRAPGEAIRVLRNLEVYGDPAGYGQALRREWAHGQPRKVLSEEPSGRLLFWVGCQAAFHPRAKEIAQSVVNVAARAEIPLAFLGNDEMCCGDPARRLGDEALFQGIARQNIQCFEAHGINEIVTLCPHCLNTLAHEYADFGARIRVAHVVEWAAGLLDSGRLKPKRSLELACVFHDPCYFSRVNGLADCARALAGAVHGLQLQDPANCREQTFCCGAGGGHMWLHEGGTRINRVRAEQLLQTPADLVSTACPYCVTMLEDGLNEVSARPVKVLDLLEILDKVTR